MSVNKLKYFFMSIGVLSLLLLSVPTILIFFFDIPEAVFVTLNTIGLILVTLYIAVSVGINISIHAIKGEKTASKKKADAYTWLLFITAMIFQLINLMFVHFD